MIALTRVSDLSDDTRAAIRALSQAVYPPDQVRDWPGKTIEWSLPSHAVLVYDESGRLVSTCGAQIREGTVDDKPVKIGGISGVMTHPEVRGQGHAARAVERSVPFFEDEAVDFALLVCKPQLLAYYGRHGWQEFTGELRVRQHGEPATFVYNRPMTLGVALAAPVAGTIDLRGPPW